MNIYLCVCIYVYIPKMCSLWTVCPCLIYREIFLDSSFTWLERNSRRQAIGNKYFCHGITAILINFLNYTLIDIIFP